MSHYSTTGKDKGPQVIYCQNENYSLMGGGRVIRNSCISVIQHVIILANHECAYTTTLVRNITTDSNDIVIHSVSWGPFFLFSFQSRNIIDQLQHTKLTEFLATYMKQWTQNTQLQNKNFNFATPNYRRYVDNISTLLSIFGSTTDSTIQCQM